MRDFSFNENLQFAMLILSERDKQILYGHVLMDLTHSEIATKLSMSLPAVQKSISETHSQATQ